MTECMAQDWGWRGLDPRTQRGSTRTRACAEEGPCFWSLLWRAAPTLSLGPGPPVSSDFLGPAGLTPPRRKLVACAGYGGGVRVGARSQSSRREPTALNSPSHLHSERLGLGNSSKESGISQVTKPHLRTCPNKECHPSPAAEEVTEVGEGG